MPDKENAQNLSQGQFDFLPSDSPMYEYSTLISFSSATNGTFPLTSSFGVDSELTFYALICTDSAGRVAIVADTSPTAYSQFQPAGVPGVLLAGVFSLTPATLWIPVKDALNIQISGLATGNVQIVCQWRMRADMVLPSQEKFKRFSEPTF